MPTSMGLESWYRATELLGVLGESPEALGVAALSERLELPKSTVARYLSVLGELGFVQQSPGDTRYHLGPTLYVLGRAVPLDTLVRDAAHPHLVALTERTGETSMMVVVSGTDGLCVEKIECTHAMRLTARVGERVPLHCGGSPRCLLAFLPEAEREAYLARPLEARSPMTLTDPAALRAEAAETRAQGIRHITRATGRRHDLGCRPDLGWAKRGDCRNQHRRAGVAADGRTVAFGGARSVRNGGGDQRGMAGCCASERAGRVLTGT